MAAPRPTSSRMENGSRLTDKQKAIILSQIRLDSPSPINALFKQSPHVTPITTSPWHLGHIPTETSNSTPPQYRSKLMTRAGSARPSSATESIRAGMNGVTDALPFGIGNHVTAAINAAVHGDILNNPVGAYDDSLRAMREQDAYDEVNHRAARTAGKVVSAVDQTFIPGAAFTRFARLPEAAGLAGHEALAIFGTGAAGGAATQAIADFSQQKPSRCQTILAAWPAAV